MQHTGVSLHLINGADFRSTLRAMLLFVAVADHKSAAAADEPRAPAPTVM